jgi:hypothetical protein
LPNKRLIEENSLTWVKLAEYIVRVFIVFLKNFSNKGKKMITRVGICTLLAGLFVGIFSGISSFMEAKTIWVGLTISKIIGEDKSESIITLLDVAVIQNTLDFLIYEVPFFLFLIGVGIIILFITLFLDNK